MAYELKRDFHLSDVLSVTMDRLLSNTDMDGYCDIMGFVTGDPDITTIGHAIQTKAAKETILEQYPELADVSEFPVLPKNDRDERNRLIDVWLNAQIKKFGERIFLVPTNVPLVITPEEQADFAKRINPNLKIAKL